MAFAKTVEISSGQLKPWCMTNYQWFGGVDKSPKYEPIGGNVSYPKGSLAGAKIGLRDSLELNAGCNPNAQDKLKGMASFHPRLITRSLSLSVSMV